MKTRAMRARQARYGHGAPSSQSRRPKSSAPPMPITYQCVSEAVRLRQSDTDAMAMTTTASPIRAQVSSSMPGSCTNYD